MYASCVASRGGRKGTLKTVLGKIEKLHPNSNGKVAPHCLREITVQSAVSYLKSRSMK